MKPLILLLSIIALVGCKKTYKCDCTLKNQNITNSGAVTNHYTVKAYKRTATRECDEMEYMNRPDELSARDCSIVK